MTKTIGLKLEPLDVLFLRDGRPFGAATHGKSTLPMPQTVAGAVWTALLDAAGCDFSRFVDLVRGGTQIREAMQETCGTPWIASVKVRGPWLARLTAKENEIEVLVPVPTVLHAEKATTTQEDNSRLHRLSPLSPDRLPGWQALESFPGLWPLWLRCNRPTEPASGYLTSEGLRAFLHGEPVTLDQRVKPEELFDFDRRTGIGIQPDRLSAEEGLIYGASFLTLRTDVFFYVDVIVPDDGDHSLLDTIKTLPLGGEGRRVRSTMLRETYRWPEPASHEGNRKPLLVLTTPGCFTAGWRPAVLNGQLLAAAVPGSLSVSGWDLARGGPKPNRFAAQAGSVFFLNEPLDPWPETLSDNDRDAQQGWGCYLKGVWIDE